MKDDVQLDKQKKNEQITTNTVWLQMKDTQLEIMYMCTKKSGLSHLNNS